MSRRLFKNGVKNVKRDLSKQSEDFLLDMLTVLKVRIPMEKEDILLMFLLINTEEKLREFETWIRSKMDGTTFQVTAEEIMHKANKIGGKLTVDE